MLFVGLEGGVLAGLAFLVRFLAESEHLFFSEIHAFIYDATVLEYNAGRDKDCDLITVGKWYAMTGYGVGFPKGSPYVEEVNQVLLDLQRNGMSVA